MTLNDLYLVSQIATVVLIVPTLVYLALQVRQNTLQMRATARFQWVEASGQLNVLLAGSTDNASVFRRGWDDPVKNGLDPKLVAFVEGLRDAPEASYDLRGAGKPAGR